MQSTKEAEKHIHQYAKAGELDLTFTDHSKKRSEERCIITSDLLYVLGNGSINDAPEKASRKGFHKYKICRKSPNSGSRTICLVVIFNSNRPAIKVITVMWEDW